jgi:two-component sensor histidine kinase
MASSGEEESIAQETPKVEEIFGALDAPALESDEARQWLDCMPIAIVIAKSVQNRQRLVYANTAFETLIGRAFDDFAGDGWAALAGFRHESDGSELDEAVVSGKEDFLGAFRREAPESLIVEAYAGAIEKEDGSENYRIAALIDVTHRERAEREAFARQLQDKDLLLKELQHRVRNNLQLITALIRLEAHDYRRGDAVNLDRLAGRIESLQLLYQALLPDSLGADVELGSYVSQIATAVMNTYATEGIRLNLKVDHAPVSINIAMPVGLIVNELLTNAFKYAFAGRQGGGVITLECLRLEGDRHQIAIADDGVGFPEGVKWPVAGKLGALILQTLRENAETELRFESGADRGTRVTITFEHRARERKRN